MAQTDSYIYIATERLIPLNWHLKRKILKPETIKWGLCSVAVGSRASMVRRYGTDRCDQGYCQVHQ